MDIKFSRVDLYHNFLEKINNASNNSETAVENYKKAIEIKFDYYEAYNNLGLAYLTIGSKESAKHAYENAIRLNPKYVAAYNNLENFFKATESYKMALRSKPFFAEALSNLIQINELPKENPLQKLMVSSLSNAKLPYNDRMLLNFALGKMHDDANEPTVAFHYFKSGNDLRKSMYNYDLRQDRDLVKRLKHYFSVIIFLKVKKIILSKINK